MPKMKTHRGAAKRLRKTGSGKVKHGAAFRRHLLSNRSMDRKRSLRGSRYVCKANEKAVALMLPN
jgi:large subunit ribosomal protein L35